MSAATATESLDQPLDRGALARLLGPIRGRLALAVACQALSAVAGIAPFVAVAELGRELLAPGPVDERRAWAIAAAGAAALLVRLVLVAVAGGVSHLADNELQLDVRRRLADRLGRAPLGWFSERHSGEVKKALQDDVTAMHHLVAHALLDLTTAVVVPLASLAYLVAVDWRMTLITLVPVAAGLALYTRLYAGYGEKMAAYTRAQAEISAAAVEFVQGIAVVKAFGQGRRAHRRFLEASDRFAAMFGAWIRGVMRLSVASDVVLSPLAVLLCVLAGGTALVAAGGLAVVDVLPFVLLGLGLTAPLLTLGYGAENLRQARAAAARVAALLDTPVLPEPVADAVPEGARVEFDAVRFSYDGGTEALRGVDLVLEPGTVTALVGPSGSGKTTLARLLPRFWDVTAGAIRIGGADVRELRTEQLYRQIGFVFQDVQLLRASVRDNIRLARPSADHATVEAAARAAQIHERILELPGGYDAVVGEGARLSGGEAQRVSIARALLADAPVLVLDEATAFADPESEAAIQDALSTLVAGRTLLVIAHRLHTIVEADQIAVLDDGEIVERGGHGELLAAGGLYTRLWAAHARGADAASAIDGVRA